MLIKSEFDIQFRLDTPTPMVAMLHLHPSVEHRLRSGNLLSIEQIGVGGESGESVAATEYEDSFGNRCTRFVASPGHLRLGGWNIVEAEDRPDPVGTGTLETPVQELADQVLRFLLPSRYCEVDRFLPIAKDLFGWMEPGWGRAAAIRDWVNEKITFDYKTARPTKTALDAFTERVGVCRDFQHLAITLSRCLNIPARYVTGYLGDVRHPYSGPGDFSAWYEVWLGDRWWTMDARHNEPRYGRVLMATGRDAADVAITTSFGNAELKSFRVESNEVDATGKIVTYTEPEPATHAA